jgi:hypothetical protein
MMTILLWLFNYIPSFFLYIAFALGVVLYLFSEMATLRIAQIVTSSYLTPALMRLIGVTLMGLSIFFLGISFSDTEFKKELDKKNAEIAKINEEAKDITQQVVIKYVYRDKIIKEKGDEIIKYVTKENDASCDLHNSTIELLNAAAKNNLPDAARSVDATSSGVELSTVEKVIIENYNKYNELKNKNDLLQEWVREQQKNNK